MEPKGHKVNLDLQEQMEHKEKLVQKDHKDHKVLPEQTELV
jgi:hypothetical protein